jgi:hypothetical protein
VELQDGLQVEAVVMHYDTSGETPKKGGGGGWGDGEGWMGYPHTSGEGQEGKGRRSKPEEGGARRWSCTATPAVRRIGVCVGEGWPGAGKQDDL